MCRGVSPLLLSGMGESSQTHDVTIWRPLLSHTKDEIYAFAHRCVETTSLCACKMSAGSVSFILCLNRHSYGVPYFKDTTPSWSTRGKLRNQLVPLLIDMYGVGCLRNLSSLATASDDMKSMVDDNIFLPFQRSIVECMC